MAKAFIYLVCLFLVASLSKSAPILDEEVVDEDFNDPEELLDDINNADDPEDRKSENDDENYEESKRTDDDYNDGGNDEENDEDNEEDGDVKSNENDEVEVVEEIEGKENQEDEEEEEEGEEGTLDDQGVHDVTNRVVEDSDGDMDLERKPDRLDKDDLEDEEEADEDGLQDMGQQISKLKKVFQEDMPREIEKLKSSSESLRHDLDSLNTKLENFLKENGIKQSDATAPTKPDSYDDDLM